MGETDNLTESEKSTIPNELIKVVEGLPSTSLAVLSTRRAISTFPCVAFSSRENYEKLLLSGFKSLLCGAVSAVSMAKFSQPLRLNIDWSIVDDRAAHAYLSALFCARSRGNDTACLRSIFRSAECARQSAIADKGVYQGGAYASLTGFKSVDDIYSVSLIDAKDPSFERPVWIGKAVPVGMKSVRSEFIRRMTGSPNKWDWWHDWFLSLWEGAPIPWELQRRVALIDDAIWEAGPEAVAEEIEKIRALFDLEKRIEELEAERDVVNARQDRLGIGGNNPPESIDDAPEIIRETTVIWAAVDELKNEIAKDMPDKAVVERIVETLSAVLKAIVFWCGKKGDYTVEQIIRWGVPVGGAYLVTNPDKVAAVIEAAKDLIGLL